MVRADNRNAAEVDYVNQPDPSTSRRPELETGGNHAESGTKLLRAVAVGFGVLCILQVVLNVSLRLALNKPQPTPDEVFCVNDTQLNDTCELKEETRQYLQKGWLYFRDSFYYMSTVKKTWPESQKFCQEEDADLVIINSREEQDFVTQFSTDKFTWIGLQELPGTDQWIWVDGAPLTESYWGTGEPNRRETKNPICVEMRFFDPENSWNDISCTTENVWMCEKEAAL